MADSEVKGYILRATETCLNESFDAAAQDRIRGRLSDRTRQVTGNLTRSHWYPGSCWNELIEAVSAEESSHSAKVDRMRTIGRYLAMDATGTYLRLLLKLFTPGMFLRKLPSFFERDMRPGHVKSDLSDLDNRRVMLSIEGAEAFSYLAPIAAGWIQFVFDQIGVKKSKVHIVRPPTDVVRSGDILFEITWN
jgi:hypothetical protein